MRVVYACLLCLLCHTAFAQVETDAFERGVAAYESGAYVPAIQAFGGLVEDGYVSPALYYNLANAYYQNEQIGPAVLYYEQAKRLAPGDAEIDAALTHVRAEVMDGAFDVPPFLLVAAARRLRDTFPALVWALLAFGAAYLGAYGLYQWRSGTERAQRKRGFVQLLIGVSLLLPLAALTVSRQAVARSSGVYIVLRDNLPLREAPSEGARRLETLPAGYRLERTDRLDPWIAVVTPSGTTGWVATGAGVQEVR